MGPCHSGSLTKDNAVAGFVEPCYSLTKDSAVVGFARPCPLTKGSTSVPSPIKGQCFGRTVVCGAVSVRTLNKLKDCATRPLNKGQNMRGSACHSKWLCRSKNSALSGFVGLCHPLTKDSAKERSTKRTVLKDRATPSVNHPLFDFDRIWAKSGTYLHFC